MVGGNYRVECRESDDEEGMLWLENGPCSDSKSCRMFIEESFRACCDKQSGGKYIVAIAQFGETFKGGKWEWRCSDLWKNDQW